MCVCMYLWMVKVAGLRLSVCPLRIHSRVAISRLSHIYCSLSSAFTVCNHLQNNSLNHSLTYNSCKPSIEPRLAGNVPDSCLESSILKRSEKRDEVIWYMHVHVYGGGVCVQGKRGRCVHPHHIHALQRAAKPCVHTAHLSHAIFWWFVLIYSRILLDTSATIS